MSSPLRVLLIQEHAATRRAVEASLRARGFTVMVAEDGETGWTLLQQMPDVQLILIDWASSGLDGQELCRRARKLERPGYLHIIVMAARNRKSELLLALENGADAFLTRPIDLLELQAQIRVAQRVIHLEEQLAQRANQLLRAQTQLLDAETEKKHFYSDVIRIVTQDKLHLQEASEIPIMGEVAFSVDLGFKESYAHLRQELDALARSLGMSEEDAADLVLAVGEAVTNAIQHATGGRCEIHTTATEIIARVTDRGHGIQASDLPASVLMPGFSTKVSLGMGYSLMLQLVDQVWLSTGIEGTTLQIIKAIVPAELSEEHFEDVLQRFS